MGGPSGRIQGDPPESDVNGSAVGDSTGFGGQTGTRNVVVDRVGVGFEHWDV